MRLDPAGTALGTHPAELPGDVVRMAVDDNCRIWLATREPPIDGVEQAALWTAARGDAAFVRSNLDELQQSFASTPLTIANRRGFCLRTEHDCGPCFSWYGRPLAVPLEKSAVPAQYAERGQLLTLAIDSGLPRCRWHRVRLDATIPPNTTVDVAVSTSEVPLPAAQGCRGRGMDRVRRRSAAPGGLAVGGPGAGFPAAAAAGTLSVPASAADR